MVGETIELYEDELQLLVRSKEQVRRGKQNAGLLFIPEGLRNELQENMAEDPDFEKELIEYLATPIDQRSDVDPKIMGFILKAPEEEQLRYVSFDRDPTGEYESFLDFRIESVKKVIEDYYSAASELDATDK